MRALILALFTLSFLDAKELFKSEDIFLYLTKDNPFVSISTAQESIAKQKVGYSLGEFDTKVSTKYDNKKYPISHGEYFDVSIAKPLENGLELVSTYRKATGTQEYNNIKTGKKGEVLVGAKIPLFSIVNNTNSRKLKLDLALVDSIKYGFNSKNNLRLLYTEVLTLYYNLLYSKILLSFEEELLKKIEKRANFIEQRIKVGALAKVDMIEASQQIISSKQRCLSASNSYDSNFEIFLQYLNTSKDEFTKKFYLEDIFHSEVIDIDLEKEINKALKNRADLKMLKYEKKQIDLQKKNAKLLGYPDLNIAFYGARDFEYINNNGFKIALDMAFPIERRKYSAKSKELHEVYKNLEKLEEKKSLEIKTNLVNIANSLLTIESNLQYSKQELKLVEQLADVENKKYNLGASNLFMLNQRELHVIEVKNKIVKYKLDYQLLKEQFFKVVGTQSVIK